MMRQPHWFLAVLLLLFSTPIVQADVITFEGISDSTTVTTQFPGLVFSNATAITAGISLNEFEFPPRSGSNVVIDEGSPLSISFTAPAQSFGGYFTYSTQLTLVAFDAANNPIASIMSAFSNNLALSGNPGSSPNEFLLLSTLSGISRVTITGNPSGSSFTLDDASVNEATAIPEPGTICLLLTGSAALAAFRKRFTKH